MRNALRKILVPFGAAVLFWTPQAGAQEATTGMHQSGGFILSAERLFGLSFWSIHEQRDADPAGGPGATAFDETRSGTNISLLFGSNFTGDLSQVSPYTTPRLAFDFLPIESLTIGASIGFVSSSGEVERPPTPARDTPTFTAFALAPRVGYALMLTDGIYFWPRLGVTYFNVSTTQAATPTNPEQTDSTNGFAIDIEPAFVFSPVSHFGISVMPVADIPLAGSSKSEPQVIPQPDTTVKIRNIGLTVGILGYF